MPRNKTPKRVAKIALDLILTVTLCLLYLVHPLGLTFHEVAGLIIVGILVIHISFNWKRITTALSQLFSPRLNGRKRANYIVAFLLVACFLTILVSGIAISRQLFPGLFPESGVWWTLHVFASALALIGVGVHLGLNWDFIKRAFSLHLPRPIGRVLGGVALVIVMALGVFSIATSSFSSWVAAPFMAGGSVSGTFPSGEFPSGAFPGGEPGVGRGPGMNLPDSAQCRTVNGQMICVDTPGSNSGEPTIDEVPTDEQPSAENPPNRGEMPNRGQRPNRMPDFQGGRGFAGLGPLGTIGNVLSGIAAYASIIAVFAAATRGVLALTRRLRRTKAPATPAPMPGVPADASDVSAADVSTVDVPNTADASPENHESPSIDPLQGGDAEVQPIPAEQTSADQVPDPDDQQPKEVSTPE